MDPKLLAIIALLAVGGIAAVVFIGGAPSGGDNVQSNTETSAPPTTTTTAYSGEGGVYIEGTWQGTYTSPYGSGTWKWVIKESSPGHYIGCLTTTGPYEINAWVPISITLEGNQITLGTSGVLQLIFTGTIDGDSASGSWHIVGRTDQGDWQGSRLSEESTLPCMTGPGEETTASPPASTTTTEETTTTTTEFNGDLGCTPSPSTILENAYLTIGMALADTFGADNITCANTYSGTQETYSFTLVISNLAQIDLQTISDHITAYLTYSNWTIEYVETQYNVLSIGAWQYGSDYNIRVTISIGSLGGISGAQVDMAAVPASG